MRQGSNVQNRTETEQEQKKCTVHNIQAVWSKLVIRRSINACLKIEQLLLMLHACVGVGYGVSFRILEIQ